jgi:hypothetical protein
VFVAAPTPNLSDVGDGAGMVVTSGYIDCAFFEAKDVDGRGAWFG